MLLADPLKESAVWLEEVDPEELRARSGSTRPVSPQINTSQDPLGTGTADVFGSVNFMPLLVHCIYKYNNIIQ